LLEFWHDEDADTFALRLNPTLLEIYRAGWTGVDVGVRRQLRRKPLALWLHGWLSSNAQNYPTKLDTIRALSGSTNKQAAGFKRHLQDALSDLVTVGFLDGYGIDGDLVSVTRTPSPTQARHLARKRKGPVDK